MYVHSFIYVFYSAHTRRRWYIYISCSRHTVRRPPKYQKGGAILTTPTSPVDVVYNIKSHPSNPHGRSWLCSDEIWPEICWFLAANLLFWSQNFVLYQAVWTWFVFILELAMLAHHLLEPNAHKRVMVSSFSCKCYSRFKISRIYVLSQDVFDQGSHRFF